jgi:hypothetical protein
MSALISGLAKRGRFRVSRFHAAMILVFVEVRGFSSSHAAAGRSRRRPLSDKLFVQPVTAVVASPNLSTHKPAGNCASRDDDRA